MIVNGNHEYGVSGDVERDPWGKSFYMPEWGFFNDNDSGGECGLHIHWKFPFDKFSDESLMSGRQENGFLLGPGHGKAFPPFYYSFDYGTVHFVALSSEHSFEDHSEQKIWFENDLNSVNRCITPFVVILLHRPLYAPIVDEEDYITALNLLQIYEPILIKYKVDFILNGHVHGYYSISAINNQKCNLHHNNLKNLNSKNSSITKKYYNRDNDNDWYVDVNENYCLRSLVMGTAGHKIDSFEAEDIAIAEKVITSKWGFGKFEVKGKDQIKMSFVTTDNNDVEDEVIFKNQGLCEGRKQISKLDII